MFVGESGVGRILQRTAEAMLAAGIQDPSDIERIRDLGVIDFPTLQKKINFHFSVTLDLFGSEISTNAANVFNAGLKGRFHENKIEDDHQLLDDTYPVLKVVDGIARIVDEPALNAINARLLDDYIRDAQGGVNRWNKILQKLGVDYEIKLPHRTFHRAVGEFRDIEANPDGQLLSVAEWARHSGDWLPSADDGEYLLTLMRAESEPGKYASWIAAPRVGINNQPGDFEYVKIQ